MLRRSYTLLRGRYSSMMDLGGVAPADCKAKIDFSRNNKLKAVALDFKLLTRSIEATEEKMVLNNTQQKERQDTIKNKTVVPDVSLVENIANLLNISLPGGSTKKNINTSKSTIESKTNETFANTTKAPPVTDIREKYAAKLRKKDIHSLDRDILDNDSNPIMKGHQIGDASGHLRVKNMIRKDPSISSSANTGSKWITHSGTGKLLKFLTDRSMKIALLPIPRTTDNGASDNGSINITKQSELSAMQNLSNQLKKDVSFHKLIQEGPDAQQALDQFFSSLHYEQKEDEGTKSLDAINNRTTVYIEKECLVVSDRDDYLRFARDQGMFTCRVRPLNAPRGNVTTNYTVEDVNEIEDIINELNGLSFGNILGSK